jgi:hypothetical protein
MNRRHFVTASGLLAISPALRLNAEEVKQEIDWNSVILVTKYTAQCEEFGDYSHPDIRLEVTLKPRIQDQDKGEFFRTKNLIQFDLLWDGTKIQIPERFWKDITGIEIQIYPEEKIKNQTPDNRARLARELRHPRLSLSAEKGTVLIEWQRAEDACDCYSTFRWMITKSGAVLRHHLDPPKYG